MAGVAETLEFVRPH